MGRGDLSDAEWELIGLVLPSERGRSARPPALRQVELRLYAVPTLG